MIDRRTLLAATAGATGALALTPALAGGHGRLATFSGESGHVASGRAEIADGRVNLLDDFQFDGAPDPKVALGRGGYDPATLMGDLQADSGAQSYAVPDGIDPSQYDEVWIWCEEFDVPLAVARF